MQIVDNGLIEKITGNGLPIELSPALMVAGTFLLLGVVFMGIQISREYYWLKSMGGIDSMLYDLEE